jgi:hemolysin III
MERITLGRMQNPVRGFLHGGAALASVIGMITLMVRNRGNGWVTLALVVYGGSLVMMFTTSSLYHSVPWSERWKGRMRRLDHTGIFLVVAGSYTPFAVVALDGAWQWGSLLVVWGMGLAGIVIKFVERRVRLGLSVTLQSVMGWGAVIPMIELARRLGGETVAWLALGGVLYTAGMIFMLTNWPKLAPRIFSHHELFHVLVIGGALTHFLVVLQVLIPMTGTIA